MGRKLLILVGSLFVIFAFVQNRISSNIFITSERVNEYHSEIHAENISNSVMDFAVTHLIENLNWRDSLTVEDYENADISLSFNDINQYTLNVQTQASYNGKLATTNVELWQVPLSYYAYFTDIEPNNIYFIGPNIIPGLPGDILNGPVHTNGVMRMVGNPVFNGPVTTPNMWVGHPSFTNNPEFNGTTDFNAPQEFLHQADYSGLINAAQNSNLAFNSDIAVRFLANGNIQIRDYPNGPENVYHASDLANGNGVIASTGTIHVKGTVNGSYSVYSTEDIIIDGDLLYNEDPVQNPNSTDMLGLVSEKNVRVHQNAHQDNGTQNVNVHASIVAKGSSFGADAHDSGSPRGNLNLLGGIIQVERGPVGTFNSNAGTSTGYMKNYNYDTRFQETVPPFFPRRQQYGIRSWFTTVSTDYSNPL